MQTELFLNMYLIVGGLLSSGLACLRVTPTLAVFKYGPQKIVKLLLCEIPCLHLCKMPKPLRVTIVQFGRL